MQIGGVLGLILKSCGTVSKSQSSISYSSRYSGCFVFDDTLLAAIYPIENRIEKWTSYQYYIASS